MLAQTRFCFKYRSAFHKSIDWFGRSVTDSSSLELVDSAHRTAGFLSALDSYNATVNMALSTFFLRPQFDIMTRLKNNPIIKHVTLSDPSFPQAEDAVIRFFDVFAINRRRGRAKGCQLVFAPLPTRLLQRVKDRTSGFTLIETLEPLRWDKDFEDGQTVAKTKLHEFILKSLRWKVDIAGKPRGWLSVVVYTVESTNENLAYFSTKAMLPLKVPKQGEQPTIVEIKMAVEGDNFDADEYNLYRIIVKSVSEVEIIKVTALVYIRDFATKIWRSFGSFLSQKLSK